MNPQRTHYLHQEMNRMVEVYHSGQQFVSPSSFAIEFVNSLIDRLIREANLRAANDLCIKIKRHEMPVPYNEHRYVRYAILNSGLDVNQEDYTIEQLAGHFKDSIQDNVLIEAISRLESDIQRIGYEAATGHVGLLLGLVSRGDFRATQVQLTNRNGRIVCKLEGVDVEGLKRALPHLYVIDTAIGKKGMADAVAKYLRNRHEMESGDIVNYNGSVCIEVFKHHLNMCFYRSTFNELYEFLKMHKQPDCITNTVELAA